MNDVVLLGQSVHKPSDEFQYPKVLLDAPEHPDSVALIEIWRRHEAQDGMRVGRDIPSRALARLLPSIVISEPDPDWKDGRARVAGSVSVERFGRDVTGLKLSDIYRDDPESIALFMTCARRANEMREPVLIGARVLSGRTELMCFEIVLLPVYAADGTTPRIMLGTFRF